MQTKISREHFSHYHYRNKRRILEHLLTGTKKPNLIKTPRKTKINVVQQPIPSNLGFKQPHHSTGEMVILQTEAVASSANGRGNETYFILRRERETHSHLPLPAPFPGRGPAVSVSNSIPGLQNPLEGIQSHTCMTWLSPFSWYKPGYVLNTWLVPCILLILSHSSSSSLPPKWLRSRGKGKVEQQ